MAMRTRRAFRLRSGSMTVPLLLFAKDPQKWFVSSTVKCVQFYGTKVQKPLASQQIYGGSVFEVVDQAVAFVMSHIDARVGERTQSAQVDVAYELPVQAVTESIVNACVHRDYLSTGSVQVMLFKDRLEVWNPGRLPKGMTVEKLAGEHASLPVNPLLANPVYLAGYIEQVGTGTNYVIDRCVELGLRRPEFRQDEDFIVVMWRKEVAGTVQSDPERSKSDPNLIQNDPNLVEQVYQLIVKDRSISRARLSELLNVSERQVRAAIEELRDKRIRRKGTTRGEWEIIG